MHREGEDNNTARTSNLVNFIIINCKPKQITKHRKNNPQPSISRRSKKRYAKTSLAFLKMLGNNKMITWHINVAYGYIACRWNY